MHLSTKILISIIIFICTSCSKSPEAIVKKYLNAKTIEERLSCVKQDDDAIRLMKKRYDEDYFRDAKKYRYKDFYFLWNNLPDEIGKSRMVWSIPGKLGADNETAIREIKSKLKKYLETH